MDKCSTQEIKFLSEIIEQNEFWRLLDKRCKKEFTLSFNLYRFSKEKINLKQIYKTFNRALLRKGPTDIHLCICFIN